MARDAARDLVYKQLDRQAVGLIAQDVEKVLPQLVHTSEAGYKSIRYDLITAFLVEAVKEQQKMIYALETKLTERDYESNNSNQGNLIGE